MEQAKEAWYFSSPKSRRVGKKSTKASLNQWSSPSELQAIGQYLQWGLGWVWDTDEETDTCNPTHHRKRQYKRRSQTGPKAHKPLDSSFNQRLNWGKCWQANSVISLGSEVTVLFFIGLSVFLKFPKTNIYYINNRGEFLKKFSSSTSSRNRSPAPNSLPLQTGPARWKSQHCFCNFAGCYDPTFVNFSSWKWNCNSPFILKSSQDGLKISFLDSPFVLSF